MSRSTLSKVVSVGRATVVAALLGAASMAFAGNGDPWILGQGNSATTITSLAGGAGVDGPMLRLTNNDSGSDDTALDLNVQSGEPPMPVDTQTKVTNLNADRLDGQSELSATGPGQNEALANDGGSAKVAVSLLVGGVQASGNSVQCFDNYDENLSAVNCRSAAGR